MNKELQCNIVNDLLPLYMDDLTSKIVRMNTGRLKQN